MLKSLFLILALAVFLQPALAQTTAPEARAFVGEYKPGMLSEAHKASSAGKENASKKPERQPNVEIWLPPNFQKSEEKWPLLIYSHGFGGCAKQSEFLTAYLANQGYIVIAPDHADATCAGQQSSSSRLSRLSANREGTKGWPERPFRAPDKWTDKTERDRKDDVLFALSSMLDDRRYKNYIDTDRMGLIGYDLGGYTMLGLAGAWPTWKDARFRAVVALSPYLGPFMKGRLRNVNVSVLYQGGTRDSNTKEIRRTGGAYAQTPSVRYFVELDKANHESWTDMDRDYQDIIRRSALAFVNRYVKGDESVVIDEAKKPKIKTFWKDEQQAEKE